MTSISNLHSLQVDTRFCQQSALSALPTIVVGGEKNQTEFLLLHTLQDIQTLQKLRTNPAVHFTIKQPIPFSHPPPFPHFLS